LTWIFLQQARRLVMNWEQSSSRRSLRAEAKKNSSVFPMQVRYNRSILACKKRCSLAFCKRRSLAFCTVLYEAITTGQIGGGRSNLFLARHSIRSLYFQSFNYATKISGCCFSSTKQIMDQWKIYLLVLLLSVAICCFQQ